MSQGLLLWLLLSPSVVGASRGPLRPLCRPVNATLAAENEACPVCITFTTSVCAGYCPSTVSLPSGPGPRPDPRQAAVAPGQGHSYCGGWEDRAGIQRRARVRDHSALFFSLGPRFEYCRLPCRLCPSLCAPTVSCASRLCASLAAPLVWTPWSPSPWPSAAAAGPAVSAALTAGVPGLNRWPATSPTSPASSSSEELAGLPTAPPNKG